MTYKPVFRWGPDVARGRGMRGRPRARLPDRGCLYACRVAGDAASSRLLARWCGAFDRISPSAKASRPGSARRRRGRSDGDGRRRARSRQPLAGIRRGLRGRWLARRASTSATRAAAVIARYRTYGSSRRGRGSGIPHAAQDRRGPRVSTVIRVTATSPRDNSDAALLPPGSRPFPRLGTSRSGWWRSKPGDAGTAVVASAAVAWRIGSFTEKKGGRLVPGVRSDALADALVRILPRRRRDDWSGRQAGALRHFQESAS